MTITDNPECVCCRHKAATIEAAIDRGWAPSFFAFDPDGKAAEYAGPVCDACLRRHFQLEAESGDYFLKASKPILKTWRKLSGPEKPALTTAPATAETMTANTQFREHLTRAIHSLQFACNNLTDANTLASPVAHLLTAAALESAYALQRQVERLLHAAKAEAGKAGGE